MNQDDLKRRTKAYAINILALADRVPRSLANDVLIRQLIRSATSVGANYRAACRAKSSADFVAKMGIVEEEADETLFWLEVLTETGKLKRDAHVDDLMIEGSEIVAISVASIRTARNTQTKR